MIFASLTLQRDAWHYICYMALLHWRCRCRVMWVFHCSVLRAFRCRCFFLLKLKLQQQTSTSSITEFRACLSPRMHKSKRPIQFLRIVPRAVSASGSVFAQIVKTDHQGMPSHAPVDERFMNLRAARGAGLKQKGQPGPIEYDANIASPSCKVGA